MADHLEHWTLGNRASFGSGLSSLVTIHFKSNFGSAKDLDGGPSILSFRAKELRPRWSQPNIDSFSVYSACTTFQRTSRAAIDSHEVGFRRREPGWGVSPSREDAGWKLWGSLFYAFSLNSTGSWTTLLPCRLKSWKAQGEMKIEFDKILDVYVSWFVWSGHLI